MADRMVVIRTFSNEFDALYAKAELEASGIYAKLAGEGSVYPPLHFTRGIRLLVPEHDAEAADEVLGTEPEFE